MKAVLPLLLCHALCVAAVPAFGRVLTVVDDITDPMTLDPQKQFSEKNHTICQQIFDGLIRFDPDGRIEAALAEKWERVDPVRMRFHLRRGVSFHNGEPFDSSAVKFSLERYLDTSTGFPARAFLDSIERVETPDPYTADIITKYPDGILLNRLAGFVLIAPPRYLAEKGEAAFSAHPVGTGAFTFKSWEKGRAITLEANGNYWLKGYPKVSGLVFRFLPVEKQLDALFSGEADLVTNLPGSQTLKVKRHPGSTVLKKASFYTVPSAMNLSSGPLKDISVRKALNFALDKSTLIRYDLLGNGAPIATFSMAGESGHNEKLRPYGYNLKKAKELLHKAGYPKGLTLSVLVKENAERTARIIIGNLSKAGIRFNTTLVTDADMIREFSKRDYDMAIGDIPDPMCHTYFMQTMLLSSGSPYSLGGDPLIDKKLHAMVTAPTMEETEKAAKDIDEYIHLNALSLFTYQKIALYGSRKDLNFLPYLSRMPYFYRTYFDEIKTHQ